MFSLLQDSIEPVNNMSNVCLYVNSLSQIIFMVPETGFLLRWIRYKQ